MDVPQQVQREHESEENTHEQRPQTDAMAMNVVLVLEVRLCFLFKLILSNMGILAGLAPGLKGGHLWARQTTTFVKRAVFNKIMSALLSYQYAISLRLGLKVRHKAGSHAPVLPI